MARTNEVVSIGEIIRERTSLTQVKKVVKAKINNLNSN